MARKKTILVLAACGLFAALASPVLVQSDDDRANSGTLAELKQVEVDIARIEAAIERIEKLVDRERAKLEESSEDILKTDPKNDGDDQKQDIAKDDDKSAEGQEDAAATADLVDLDSMEKYIVEYTNAYRQKRGLPPLQYDGKLSKASKDHSDDMKRLNFFSHRSPVSGKNRFTDRATIATTTASAENIAQGAEDGKSALGLWLNSQHHRENIVGDYRRIGVGRSDGYYTQLFGK